MKTKETGTVVNIVKDLDYNTCVWDMKGLWTAVCQRRRCDTLSVSQLKAP